MSADVLNFLQREMARAKTLVEAETWLNGITSTDGATSESKARLEAARAEEAQAKNDVATAKQMLRDIYIEGDKAREAFAADMAESRASDERAKAAANDEARAIIASAQAAAGNIVQAAQDEGEQLKATYASIRADIEAAMRERDDVASQAAAARAKLADVRGQIADTVKKLAG